MKIKAIVVEDEQGAANALLSLIAMYAPEIEVVEHVKNVKDAIISLNRNEPDLVFLDMDLKGENGLDLLKAFETKAFEVIITTAYSEYALPAYQFAVTDYLIKPISPSQLKRATSRVLEQLTLKKKALQVDGLYRNIISYPSGSEEIQVQVAQIIRMQASRNYTWIHRENLPAFLVSKNISRLETVVMPFGFLRVHQSHLLNPRFIAAFNKKLRQIELKDGTRIPVAREKAKGMSDIDPNHFLKPKSGK